MAQEHTLPSGMRVWIDGTAGGRKRPAVLVLHERYGVVEHSFNQLRQMAAEGFVSVMPDLFHRFQGDRGPLERSETRFDPTDAETLADLDETIALLDTLPDVDTSNLGMVGFCQSGRVPLVFAAARDRLSAAAIVHGGIYPRDYDASLPGQESTATMVPRVHCPVLGVFGENDPLVPLENVVRFRGELREHAKSHHLRVIAGVPHGWLNSTTPDAYRPAEAAIAWETIVTFFREVFGGAWASEQPIDRFEADESIPFDFNPAS